MGFKSHLHHATAYISKKKKLGSALIYENASCGEYKETVALLFMRQRREMRRGEREMRVRGH